MLVGGTGHQRRARTLPAVGTIVFRCDGDDEIGAGHVSRCLQIAVAMRTRGQTAVIAGSVSGVAAGLVEAAGLTVVPAQPGAPAGVPDTADAAVVDSYTIASDEIEAAAALRPVAVVVDDGPVPRATAALAYHLDAERRIEAPPGVTRIFGPAYAPVRPACAAARRPRGLEHALVTLGGSNAGVTLLDPLVETLLGLDPGLEVFVAGSAAPPARERMSAGLVPGGLLEQIGRADVAVSGAGSTPYELACAGVPSVLVALADNQAPVGAAFQEAGIAGFADARGGLARAALEAALAPLADPDARAGMARAGPAAIDGYGSFRTADALLAAFGARPLRRCIAYRPADQSDADRLLAWRNDAATRAASRDQGEVDRDTHLEWLQRAIADPVRTLLVAETDGAAVGTVRFDGEGDEVEIGVTVAPEARAGGLGAQIIREAAELQLHARPRVARVRAEIRPGNTRSVAAFERAGFARRGESAELSVFIADRESLAHAGRG
ncbi:MAG: hypothetical protein QOH13_2763 [Thermoleophilaceae bacterium]|nr:hypothetical protein [Thermoleophilaceae bacterium]